MVVRESTNSDRLNCHVEEFTASWQKGQVSNVGTFESLLIVVCRGQDTLEGFDCFRLN